MLSYKKSVSWIWKKTVVWLTWQDRIAGCRVWGDCRAWWWGHRTPGEAEDEEEGGRLLLSHLVDSLASVGVRTEVAPDLPAGPTGGGAGWERSWPPVKALSLQWTGGVVTPADSTAVQHLPAPHSQVAANTLALPGQADGQGTSETNNFKGRSGKIYFFFISFSSFLPISESDLSPGKAGESLVETSEGFVIHIFYPTFITEKYFS